MSTCSSILAWKFHGQRILVGYRPWGHKESDMAERLSARIKVIGEEANVLIVSCTDRSPPIET